MYSNKENINILTSLLIEWGVHDAVVCPGSRNAAIVHNLSVCGAMRCHPITDERSAAFYALGIALATKRPTIVCVTSGSALLNTAPAVAEAFYQHGPLVVVAADRPQQWIGQLDGQTLPQPDALGKFVRRSVSLPEPRNAEERWFCNRLVNEALYAATGHQPAPVLINVPITEPLFAFDVDTLPSERRFHRLGDDSSLSVATTTALQQAVCCARRPLIVVGQMPTNEQRQSAFDIAKLSEHFVVFAEPLSNSGATIHFDEAVRYLSAHAEQQSAYTPDYIIYIGDTLVSKPTRRWLRQTQAASCFVTPNAQDVPDTLTTLTHIVECRYEALPQLFDALCDIDTHEASCTSKARTEQNAASHRAFRAKWHELLSRFARHATRFAPQFSQMAVVKYLEEQVEGSALDICMHYANSTAVRLACIYARHYVWCNRGVNGIEGSLSTAAGFSLADNRLSVCVIGDLSFFYDQNALWNKCVGGNLRIVLLNNGGGAIFKQLPGLNSSPVADTFVGASHTTTAQGICAQNCVEYISAHNMAETQQAIDTLLNRKSNRPILLEVFTNAETDAEIQKKFNQYD